MNWLCNILWRFSPEVEGAELDEHALSGQGQERVQALAALVVGVDQLGRVERAVGDAGAAHEREVALWYNQMLRLDYLSYVFRHICCYLDKRRIRRRMYLKHKRLHLIFI